MNPKRADVPIEVDACEDGEDDSEERETVENEKNRLANAEICNGE